MITVSGRIRGSLSGDLTKVIVLVCTVRPSQRGMRAHYIQCVRRPFSVLCLPRSQTLTVLAISGLNVHVIIRRTDTSYGKILIESRRYRVNMGTRLVSGTRVLLENLIGHGLHTPGNPLNFGGHRTLFVETHNLGVVTINTLSRQTSLNRLSKRINEA